MIRDLIGAALVLVLVAAVLWVLMEAHAALAAWGDLFGG